MATGLDTNEIQQLLKEAQDTAASILAPQQPGAASSVVQQQAPQPPPPPPPPSPMEQLQAHIARVNSQIQQLQHFNQEYDKVAAANRQRRIDEGSLWGQTKNALATGWGELYDEGGAAGTALGDLAQELQNVPNAVQLAKEGGGEVPIRGTQNVPIEKDPLLNATTSLLTLGNDAYQGYKAYSSYQDASPQELALAQQELARRRAAGERVDIRQVLLERQDKGERFVQPSTGAEENPALDALNRVGRTMAYGLEPLRTALRDTADNQDISWGQTFGEPIKGLVKAGTRFALADAPRLAGDLLELGGDVIAVPGTVQERQTGVESWGRSLGQALQSIGSTMKTGEAVVPFTGGKTMNEWEKGLEKSGTIAGETSPGMDIGAMLYPDNPGAAMLAGVATEMAGDPFTIHAVATRAPKAFLTGLRESRILEQVGDAAVRQRRVVSRLTYNAVKDLESESWATKRVPGEPTVPLDSDAVKTIITKNPELAVKEGLITPRDAERLIKLQKSAPGGAGIIDRLADLDPETRQGILTKYPAGRQLSVDLGTYQAAMQEAVDEPNKALRLKKMAVAESIKSLAERRFKTGIGVADAWEAEAKTKGYTPEQIDEIKRAAGVADARASKDEASWLDAQREKYRAAEATIGQPSVNEPPEVLKPGEINQPQAKGPVVTKPGEKSAAMVDEIMSDDLKRDAEAAGVQPRQVGAAAQAKQDAIDEQWRKAAAASTAPTSTALGPELDKKITDMALEGRTSREMAKELGMQQADVQRAREQLGIPSRGKFGEGESPEFTLWKGKTLAERARGGPTADLADEVMGAGNPDVPPKGVEVPKSEGELQAIEDWKKLKKRGYTPDQFRAMSNEDIDQALGRDRGIPRSHLDVKGADTPPADWVEKAISELEKAPESPVKGGKRKKVATPPVTAQEAMPSKVADVVAQATGEAGPGLPGWVRESMQGRGLDPARPLNDIDLGNKSVRDAVLADPTLSDAQKSSLLRTGSPEPPTPRVIPPAPEELKARLSELQGRMDEATQTGDLKLFSESRQQYMETRAAIQKAQQISEPAGASGPLVAVPGTLPYGRELEKQIARKAREVGELNKQIRLEEGLPKEARNTKLLEENRAKVKIAIDEHRELWRRWYDDFKARGGRPRVETQPVSGTAAEAGMAGLETPPPRKELYPGSIPWKPFGLGDEVASSTVAKRMVNGSVARWSGMEPDVQDIIKEVINTMEPERRAAAHAYLEKYGTFPERNALRDAFAEHADALEKQADMMTHGLEHAAPAKLLAEREIMLKEAKSARTTAVALSELDDPLNVFEATKHLEGDAYPLGATLRARMERAEGRLVQFVRARYGDQKVNPKAYVDLLRSNDEGRQLVHEYDRARASFEQAIQPNFQTFIREEKGITGSAYAKLQTDPEAIDKLRAEFELFHPTDQRFVVNPTPDGDLMRLLSDQMERTPLSPTGRGGNRPMAGYIKDVQNLREKGYGQYLQDQFTGVKRNLDQSLKGGLAPPEMYDRAFSEWNKSFLTWAQDQGMSEKEMAALEQDPIAKAKKLDEWEKDKAVAKGIEPPQHAAPGSDVVDSVLGDTAAAEEAAAPTMSDRDLAEEVVKKMWQEKGRPLPMPGSKDEASFNANVKMLLKRKNLGQIALSMGLPAVYLASPEDERKQLAPLVLATTLGYGMFKLGPKLLDAVPQLRPGAAWEFAKNASGKALGAVGSDPHLLGAWKWLRAGEVASNDTRPIFDTVAAAFAETGDPRAWKIEAASLQAPTWRETLGLHRNESIPIAETIHELGSKGIGQGAPPDDPGRDMALGILTEKGHAPPMTLRAPYTWWFRDYFDGVMRWFKEGDAFQLAQKRRERDWSKATYELMFGTHDIPKGENSLTAGFREAGQDGIMQRAFRLTPEERNMIGKIVENRTDDLAAMSKHGEEVAKSLIAGTLQQDFPLIHDVADDWVRMAGKIKDRLVDAGLMDQGHTIEDYWRHVHDPQVVAARRIELLKKQQAIAMAMPDGPQRDEALKLFRQQMQVAEVWQTMDKNSWVEPMRQRYGLPRNIFAGFLERRAQNMPLYSDDIVTVASNYFMGAPRVLMLNESLPEAMKVRALLESSRFGDEASLPLLSVRKRSPWTGKMIEAKGYAHPDLISSYDDWMATYFGRKGQSSVIDRYLRGAYDRLMETMVGKAPSTLGGPTTWQRIPTKYKIAGAAIGGGGLYAVDPKTRRTILVDGGLALAGARLFNRKMDYFGSYDNLMDSLKTASWYGLLASDPSFFVLNLTQTPLNTIPMLGLRYTTRGAIDLTAWAARRREADGLDILARGMRAAGRDTTAVEKKMADLMAKNYELDQVFRVAGIAENAPLHEFDMLSGKLHSPGVSSLISWMNWAGRGSESINRQLVAAGTYRKYMDAAADVEAALRAGKNPEGFIPSMWAKYKSLDGYQDEQVAYKRVLEAVKKGYQETDAKEAAFEATQLSQYSYGKGSGSILAQQSQIASLAMVYRSFFWKTMGSFYPRLDMAQRAQWFAMHGMLAGPAALPFVSWVASYWPSAKNDLERWSVDGFDPEAAKDFLPDKLVDMLTLERKDPQTGAVVGKYIPSGLESLLDKWGLDFHNRIGSGLPYGLDAAPSDSSNAFLSPQQSSLQATAESGMAGVPLSNIYEGLSRSVGELFQNVREEAAASPVAVGDIHRGRLADWEDSIKRYALAIANTAKDSGSILLDSRAADPLMMAGVIPGNKNLARFIRLQHEGGKLRDSGGGTLLPREMTTAEKIGFVAGSRPRVLEDAQLDYERARISQGIENELTQSIVRRKFRDARDQGAQLLPPDSTIAAIEGAFKAKGMKLPDRTSLIQQWAAQSSDQLTRMSEASRAGALSLLDKADQYRQAGQVGLAQNIEKQYFQMLFQDAIDRYLGGDPSGVTDAQALRPKVQPWAQQNGIDPLEGLTWTRGGEVFPMVQAKLEEQIAKRGGDVEAAAGDLEELFSKLPGGEKAKRPYLFALNLYADYFKAQQAQGAAQ